MAADARPLQCASLDVTAKTCIRAAVYNRRFPHVSLTDPDPSQRWLPLFCGPLGRCSRGAIFDYSSASLQGGGRGERHAQHCRWRGKIIVRRPLDQPPERRADWWRVKHRQKWAEAIIAHRFHIEAFLFPDHPDDLPGTKRRDDAAAMLHRHAMRHA